MKKIALVTGAGSGIGRASALALGAAGYTVVLTGRREQALQFTVEQSPEFASQFAVIPADVSQPEPVKALFAQIKADYGRLDVLFNNAGIGAPAVPIEEITFDQWQAVVGVNLTGAFLCTQEAFRLMKAQSPQGGRIINNGSISAHVPRPNSAPYTATKHAMTGLTRSASLDGRNFNIACGQIDIGNALTEMTQKWADTGTTQADGSHRIEATMNVKDVADAVVYMAGLPLSANVQFMTVMATKMPFIGRG